VLQLRDAGVLDEKESGLPLDGDPRELFRALARQIAYRQGLGDHLAEALPRAAERIGRDAARFVIDARGWPILLPSEDPRCNATKALLPAAGAYLPYNDTWALWGYWGGSFHLSITDKRETLPQTDIEAVAKRVLGDERTMDAGTFDAKAVAVWRSQTYRMLADTLGFCTWVLPLDCNLYDDRLLGDDAILGDLYSAVMGIDMSEDELLRVGERVAALDRLQGRKHGYHSREHDLRATNRRLFSEVKDDSPFPRGVIDEGSLVAELERYYALRGWDRKTGLPTEATLLRLGMDELLELAR